MELNIKNLRLKVREPRYLWYENPFGWIRTDYGWSVSAVWLCLSCIDTKKMDEDFRKEFAVLDES